MSDWADAAAVRIAQIVMEGRGINLGEVAAALREEVAPRERALVRAGFAAGIDYGKQNGWLGFVPPDRECDAIREETP